MLVSVPLHLSLLYGLRFPLALPYCSSLVLGGFGPPRAATGPGPVGTEHPPRSQNTKTQRLWSVGITTFRKQAVLWGTDIVQSQQLVFARTRSPLTSHYGACPR